MPSGSLSQRTFSWACIGLILATIAVTYTPVIAADYGYADDYWALSMRPLSREVVSGFAQNNNMEGRPLLSIWQLGVFGLCDGIRDLKYVRFLAIIGIFLASVVFYKLIRRHLLEDRVDAALAASIFAINPCFLIVGGWAENGFISYGCALGLLSIHFLLRDDKPDNEGKSIPWWNLPWKQVLPAAILLLASAFLYQPTPMIFATGVAIWLIGQFNATRADWIKLARITLFFFAVLGLYFVICHTIWPPSNRFHLSFSFVRRAGWFVVYPLTSTLSYPFIQPKAVWSIVSLYILSFGLWSYCRRYSRPMWIPLLILAISPLTVLPTVIAYVHYDVSRTRAAIYGLVIVLWIVALGEIVRRYGKGLLKLRHVLAPLLVLLIVMGQYHLERYFIMPNLWEEPALVLKFQQYARENPNLDRAIAIRNPPVNITEFHGVDEMGFASLAKTESSLYEFPVILAGVTHRKVEDLPVLKIITLKADDPAPPDAFLVDFSQLGGPR